MLDKNDIQQIGQVVDTRFQEAEKRIANSVTQSVVLAVGEMIEQQVLPQFDALYTKINTLPDKTYLDDKLADVKGDLTNLLQEKGTFTQEEVRRIRQEFQIFPAL